MLRRLLDSPWTYFSLAGLLVAVGIFFSLFRVHLPPRPKGDADDLAALHERKDLNVIYILIDTLRADHVSAYGYDRKTSPTLDYLAEHGVRFAHVESQSSWTKASMASIWSASYPRRIGVTRFQHAISQDAVLPAEIFKAAGYATAGIVRNGWVEPNFGFGQGFDVYFRAKLPSATPRKFERLNPSAHPLTGSDWDATESAIEFLRGHPNDRFLLYVHYMDVHQYTYDADSAKFGTDIRGIYDNAIHWTDRNVNALLAALEELHMLDRTVIVVGADHGESFYEHGREGHARDLYRQVTEVPLILSLPFRLPGVVVQTRIQNVDIWPTVLDLVGLDPLPASDGRSQVPAILAAARGEPEPADALRPAFAELDRTWGRVGGKPDTIVSVTKDGYRFIEAVNGEHRGDIELYQNATDPLEQRNIAHDTPDEVDALRHQVEGYVEAPRLLKAKTVHLDAMRIMQLRALGYADVGEKATSKETSKQAKGTAAAEKPAPEGGK